MPPSPRIHFPRRSRQRAGRSISLATLTLTMLAVSLPAPTALMVLGPFGLPLVTPALETATRSVLDSTPALLRLSTLLAAFTPSTLVKPRLGWFLYIVLERMPFLWTEIMFTTYPTLENYTAVQQDFAMNDRSDAQATTMLTGTNWDMNGDVFDWNRTESIS